VKERKDKRVVRGTVRKSAKALKREQVSLNSPPSEEKKTERMSLSKPSAPRLVSEEHLPALGEFGRGERKRAQARPNCGGGAAEGGKPA